jgi:hypothetical protein
MKWSDTSAFGDFIRRLLNQCTSDLEAVDMDGLPYHS